VKNLIQGIRDDRAKTMAAIDQAKIEARTASASDARDLKKFIADLEERVKVQSERIEELEENDLREARAAEHRRVYGGGVPSGWAVTGEPDTYQDPLNVPNGPSFFKDLRNARQGDWAAAERIQRNHAAVMETRTGDMTTVAGAGGQFAPPAWLVDEFIALARPGRVTANLATRDTLPAGVSSINLPKVSSGTTTGVQILQNSSLSDTAMTTTSVSSGITTIGGKQVVSLQLLNQSGIPFDRVVLADLAADYAKQLCQQVLYGSNVSGQLRGLVGVSTNTAYTTTSPALVSVTSANSFYNKVIAAAAGIATTRFLPANAVVMHPNRWAWCLQALDGNVRPIIAADGGIFNAPAISTDVVAEGSVGTIGKLPVYIDPNISLAANSVTNQDEVYVLRREDIYLWESQLLLESFEATYADQASVLFRALAWSAFIPDRYTASVASIRGTGLVAPSL
jgi:HK97 family phage major capsid protein